jgi:hypothetical protein
MSYSSRFRTTLRTTLGMKPLPNEPVPAIGSPSFMISVGATFPIGRLPPAASFAPGSLADARGLRLKRPKLSFRRNPYPGTVIPLPNASRRVVVITTAFPQRSMIEKWVV